MSVFVILKRKMRNLKLLYEKSRRHKIDFLIFNTYYYHYYYFQIGSRFSPFRLGPKGAWKGGYGEKKRLVNRASSGNRGWVVGRVQG